jgi:hypothetical protein
MTHRFQWLAGLSFGAMAAVACSSKSGPTGGTNPSDAAVENESSTGPLDSGSGEDATSSQPDAGAVMDAPATATCDAVSLAPVADAALSTCFQCIAAMCASDVSMCSTDCTCAPAFACLEAMGNNNSQCPAVMAALANSNAALTGLEGCEVMMCDAPCYGD